MKYIAYVEDQEFMIVIDRDDQIMVNGQVYNIDFQQLAEGGMLSLLLNNRSLEAIVEESDEAWDVLLRGELYSIQVLDERTYRLAQARGTAAEASGETFVKSPMPGLIVAVPVKQGQEVKKGDQVVILESMKMENELRSPRDGFVHRVHVVQGASVEKDQVLVTIGDAESDSAEKSEDEQQQ
ncbi:MAG: acetyl-CoA carboxylase biotin carboxyl carrier protein subunit [Candidatus Promineifilaceae bacterium]